MLVFVLVGFDEFTMVAAYDALVAMHPLVVLSVLGIWFLNVLLAGTLAALLRRNAGVWYLLSAVVPFAGALLPASLCRSRRASRPWAMVFPVVGRADETHINAMKASGHIERSAVVVWGKRIGKKGQKAHELPALVILGLAETMKKLPPDLRGTSLRPLFHVGRTGTLSLAVTPGAAQEAGSPSSTAGPRKPATHGSKS